MRMNPTSSPVSEVERMRILKNPGFAKYHTDNMVVSTYKNGLWSDLELVPFANRNLSPMAVSLNYAQTIFEGLKAFKTNGQVSLFRPEENARRMMRSAKRMAMPVVPESMFIEAVTELVNHESDWIPERPSASLYIRPLLYATEECMAVKPSDEFEFAVFTLPADPYFVGSAKALSIRVVDEYVRAVKGGTGEVKCGANYSASLIAKAKSAKLSCDESLWLDALEHKYVEELSGMNVMFVDNSENVPKLVTPPINGTILPGVTRDSILQLAPKLGMQIDVRQVSIDEVRDSVAAGRYSECFACGTAAVIAPIGKLVFSEDDVLTFGDGNPGNVAERLLSELSAIQIGRSEHFMEWRKIIKSS